MKTAKYLILLSLITLKSFSLTDSIKKRNILNKTLGYSFLFISGYANGTNHATQFHYSSFKKVHPNCNDNFWNPEISWRNKWKNGDPNQGEKYLGSSNVFVSFSDSFHRLNNITYTGFIGGTLLITIGEKKKWHKYLIDAAIGYAVNRAGFYIPYNLIYK